MFLSVAFFVTKSRIFEKCNCVVTSELLKPELSLGGPRRPHRESVTMLQKKKKKLELSNDF